MFSGRSALPRGLEVGDVAGVQEIEAAVRDRHPPPRRALACPPSDQRLGRQNFLGAIHQSDCASDGGRGQTTSREDRRVSHLHAVSRDTLDSRKGKSGPMLPGDSGQDSQITRRHLMASPLLETWHGWQKAIVNDLK